METANLYQNGRSQAIRLPKDFNFSGKDVYIQKAGDSVILFPKNRVALTEFLSHFTIIDFNDSDAEAYGRIRAHLKSQENLIDPYDMLIVAQAITKDLILVTSNTDEFMRIPGLKFEYWK